MIPTPEQLEEISRLHEGMLGSTVPFAALLLALGTHRRTLQVEVRRKQIAKRIFFENGVPVDCRSNLVHETLGRYMVGQGK
ncbi:MAG TPA: molecular chaperone DnaJ, partial [Thermoanaerobaculia bacterium]|nr:molecular chaperone DnaJ [Thermoanaerobaculia bacterium]